jgi:hypothetical protein
MRPLNVNYDGTGWNADYVAGITEDEFVQQFAAQYYGHIDNLNERVKATEACYAYIIQQYRKVHPQIVEKPASKPDDE